MLRVKNRIREAILYPIVILCVAMGFTLFFLAVVAPEFRQAVDAWRAAAAHRADGSTSAPDSISSVALPRSSERPTDRQPLTRAPSR